MSAGGGHPTRAVVDLGRLAHNLRVLQACVGGRPLWPCIKADAYGHGAELVGRHLVELGCTTLCVAHASEAAELLAAGVRARFLTLSAALPSDAALAVEHGLEPAVATLDGVRALSDAALRAGRRLAVHLKVDTGMGRFGIRPDEVLGFLERCRELPGLRVRGLMSHFPRAEESDKSFCEEQVRAFDALREATRGKGIEVYHLANSAGILDLPASHQDAARPGIALYGLRPGQGLRSPRAAELRPVLEWKTRITFLKEVPAGTGLSYGHSFRTSRPTLVATLPVGYGDGLRRGLSSRIEVLVGGLRCPQVGIITMDQALVDVTALRGRVGLGDEVVLIGSQGGASIAAEELAAALGTIHYEVVTGISRRVPRVAAPAPG